LFSPALAAAADFSGSGSQVIPVSLSGGLTTFGWTQSSPTYDNFIVELVDADGEDVDLLANEVGTASSGSTVVQVNGVNPPTGQYRLSLSATGSWSLSIGAVTAAPTSNLSFTGGGSMALGPLYLPGGSTAFTWTQSSPTYDNFIVELVDVGGDDVDLLANEVGTGSSGSTVVQVGGANPPPGVYMLNVSATGSWTMSLVPPPTYTLTYLAGPNGTISGVNPQTVVSGGSGTPVTAVANPGFRFTSWSDGSTNPTRTDARVAANLSVSANFVRTYTVTYVSGLHGTITGTNPQTVVYGGTGTPVTAVASPGYMFVSWSDGRTNPTRVESGVTANLTLTANFVRLYVLTYASTPNGRVSGQVLQAVAPGASGTTVTAVPNPGYRFAGWSDGLAGASRVDTNVSGDISVAASFAALPAYSTRLVATGASAVYRYRAYRLTGTLGPIAAGGRVKITWQRYYSGAYRTVRSAYGSVVAGRFVATYKPTIRGKWRVQVSYSGRVTSSAVYRPSKPIYRVFTVR
jgi:hypothetical protein